METENKESCPHNESTAFNTNDELVNDILSIIQNENVEDSNGFLIENEEHSDFDSELEEYEQMENEEIDKLLEKPIDNANESDNLNFYTYEKMQIKSLYWKGCQETALPEGWVQVTHSCGMPLYLHRETRICTLSRPYYIDSSSARKHDIPVSAIPCFAYRRRKEIVENDIRAHNMAKMSNTSHCRLENNIEKKVEENISTFNSESINQSKIDNIDLCVKNLPNKKDIEVTIQSNQDKIKENLLAPEQVNDYCRKLFDFEIMKVKKFKTWGDRKNYIKKAKSKKFPENAKLLKIQTKSHKGVKKVFNINMANKTALSILYEYACQVFKTNPRFEIKEKENPKDPFLAIVYLNDQICGKGSGNSKKAAKNTAAEEALKVLIPDYKSNNETDTKKNTEDIYSFFDSYPVDYAQIYELSQSVGAPLPYDVLLTCLRYNFANNGTRDSKQCIEEEIKPIKFRNCLYKMKLYQYEVEVNCTRKKEGRQIAAQKILKLMHPHVQTWGSILRLYGYQSFSDTIMEDPKDDSSQIDGQGKLSNTKGNTTLLEKLKEEMRKIKKLKPNPLSVYQLNLAEVSKRDTLMTIPPFRVNEEQVNKDNVDNYENRDENHIIYKNDDFKEVDLNSSSDFDDKY